MKTIWKYPIQITDIQDLAMPRGASILCVQMQGATPCIWAKVDEDQPLMRRTIRTYGTGHVITEEGPYIGTIQEHGGGLVWHVFEIA